MLWLLLRIRLRREVGREDAGVVVEEVGVEVADDGEEDDLCLLRTGETAGDEDGECVLRTLSLV